ncbi:hypothetical protein SCG7109_AH_00070 [Chlamydiales bacterium SCGC AG-110-M15]|nr:hypothetical protein SCG7109_AH_00070 [Chlamydiales bacterium SCGC AG-110-M15]
MEDCCMLGTILDSDFAIAGTTLGSAALFRTLPLSTAAGVAVGTIALSKASKRALELDGHISPVALHALSFFASSLLVPLIQRSISLKTIGVYNLQTAGIAGSLFFTAWVINSLINKKEDDDEHYPQSPLDAMKDFITSDLDNIEVKAFINTIYSKLSQELSKDPQKLSRQLIGLSKSQEKQDSIIEHKFPPGLSTLKSQDKNKFRSNLASFLKNSADVVEELSKAENESSQKILLERKSSIRRIATEMSGTVLRVLA